MGETYVSSNYHPGSTYKRNRPKPRGHLAQSHSLVRQQRMLCGRDRHVLYHEWNDKSDFTALLCKIILRSYMKSEKKLSHIIKPPKKMFKELQLWICEEKTNHWITVCYFRFSYTGTIKTRHVNTQILKSKHTRALLIVKTR